MVSLESLKIEPGVPGGFPERYAQARLSDFPEAVAEAAIKRVESGGITVCGPVGCGKTHLLAALARHFYGGHLGAVEYHRSAGIIQRIKEDFDSEWMPKNFKGIGVLVIDDLWAERETDFAVTELSELLAYRYDRNLETWVGTNANPARLPSCWERSTSRLAEMNGGPFTLTGKDRRRA